MSVVEALAKAAAALVAAQAGGEHQPRQRRKGHVCANGQLDEGEQGAEWGQCQGCGGQLVAAQGWCQAWIEKEA